MPSLARGEVCFVEHTVLPSEIKVAKTSTISRLQLEHARWNEVDIFADQNGTRYYNSITLGICTLRAGAVVHLFHEKGMTEHGHFLKVLYFFQVSPRISKC